jgi:ATP-dependent Clp protease adapter protein ClpS
MMPDETTLALAPLQPEVAEPQIEEPPTEPQVDDGSTGSQGENYRVLLYNDEFHTFDEVIFQLVKATACSLAKAEAIALEVDSRGRAICFRGEREKCQHVCQVLREIRLQCEVDCD